MPVNRQSERREMSSNAINRLPRPTVPPVSSQARPDKTRGTGNLVKASGFLQVLIRLGVLACMLGLLAGKGNAQLFRGSISFLSQDSTNCGPGKLCFKYALPTNQNAAGTVTGAVQITLSIYQNGSMVPVTSIPTTPAVLGTGNNVCFNISPATLAMITAGGFDFVARAVFTIPGSTLPIQTVGTAPTGILGGTNNDYRVTCGPPTGSKWCCPGQNLVRNGDFESGNAFFTSAHTYNASTALYATAPGAYNVVTSPQALSISPNWGATDHAVCNGFPGSKFMVVNGKTTQPAGSTRVVWQQTVSVTAYREYRFCANVKNLVQSTFDIKPRIRVQFTNPNTTIGPVTVNEPTALCNWKLISGVVTPTTNALTIKIIIEESGLGDGNDIALDDISLQEKVQAPSSLVAVNYSTVDIGNGDYNVTATAVPLPPGYSYAWFLFEWDPVNNSPILANMVISNPTTWQVTPNTFVGYNGLNGALTGTAAGKFKNGKIYRIFYSIWSDCESYRISSMLLQYTRAAMKPQTTPLPVGEQELKILQRYLPKTTPSDTSTDMQADGRKERTSENPQVSVNPTEDLVKIVKLDKLPRAEDDPSVEIAVAKPSVEAGQPAPDFKVEDANGNTLRLSDFRGKKNVLLTFFPKCFTGGCANHLSSLRDRQADFDATDTQIIAVSVDPAAGEKGQLAFAKQWQLTFPLIPDTDRRLSMLYGATRNKHQLAARMSVFIDKEGTVRFVDTDVHVATHGADVSAKFRELGLTK
jgi:peroxiredoxin